MSLSLTLFICRVQRSSVCSHTVLITSHELTDNNDNNNSNNNHSNDNKDNSNNNNDDNKDDDV